jgi:hypothetical protein
MLAGCAQWAEKGFRNKRLAIRRTYHATLIIGALLC